MTDNDGCKVGSPGGKGFALCLCRAHPQGGDENKQVAHEDDHDGDDLTKNVCYLG